MAIDLKEAWRKRKYVPKWLGQRDEVDPVIFYFHPISVNSAKCWALRREEIATKKPDEATDVLAEFILSLVAKIDNLTNGGVPVTTAQEFIASDPAIELLTEIFFAGVNGDLYGPMEKNGSPPQPS